MPPHPHLASVGTVHQAISSLLMTSEPELVRLAYSMFVTFEAIRIVWHGIWTMLGGEPPIGAITCAT
jgi:hypothetical protein